MKFDIFLSICQTEVNGYLPSERVMFENFFDQIKLADELGFGTAWIAETHLSCQVQKENADHVIPYFKGEIGLNTDILQMAHKVFAHTKKIHIGSAIRNIICNGGPMAHAEAVKTFLTLNSFLGTQDRQLELGFAAGRFPFSNTPYGFQPRAQWEKEAWDVLKNKGFHEAVEIFLRFLRGDQFSSSDLQERTLEEKDFRKSEQWNHVRELYSRETGKAASTSLKIPRFWNFPKAGVIPFEAPLKNLKLTLGSHDPEIQIFANKFFPTGIFNLSITPEKIIQETHERMKTHYHPSGGSWTRDKMPRTVMLFINDEKGLSDVQKSARANELAESAWKSYWTAMEKTLDPKKVSDAVGNTISGHPQEVVDQIQSKYHPQDRLMLWFDFNLHDNEMIKSMMRTFIEKIAPQLPS